MSNPRNSCIARGAYYGATADNVAYTVPAGNILLLKSVFFQGVTTGDLAVVQVSNPGRTVKIPVAIITMDAHQLGSWNGWVALNAGDLVIWTYYGSGAEYWFSGAVLPYTPGL